MLLYDVMLFYAIRREDVMIMDAIRIDEAIRHGGNAWLNNLIAIR